jgi:hypothetical protein
LEELLNFQKIIERVPTSVGWFFDVFQNNCQFQVFEKIKIMILGIGTNSESKNH